MKNAVQGAVFTFIIVMTSAPALAVGFIHQPVEVSLDMDDDGIMDRVVVVPDPESTNADLSFYLGAGDGKLDPSRKPTFRKEGMELDWPLLAVERKGKGSLVITSGCGGCSNDYSTTLTIVYRRGEFLVGGYTYQWDTRYGAGTCDVNFLTGKGTMLDGIDGPGKPIDGKFTPTKLQDWSDETQPKACDLDL
jgi:hypothetical protein